MSNPSNLYAEKIFSEHPLALWSLDEDVPFLSIAGQYREFSEWSVTGAVVSEDTALLPPINSLPVYKIAGDGFSGGFPGQITLTTPTLFNFADLDNSLGTVTISTYFYAQSPQISSVSMGYSYIDGLNEIDELKTFSAISPGAWGLLSETFTIPNNISADISFKIVITYTEDAVPGAQYNFFATAFSAGQYGEDANSVSVGASKELIPSNIAISQTHGIKIRNYGLDSNDGYFIVDNDILYARNYGMPMVFGKNFGTTVYDNPNGPSIIVPGLGFLNKVGQHRDMTLEAWIKIDAKTTTPKRIIGPIASTDGLYVDGPFLTLKIGNNIGSHFIYEWGRPMLIDIRIVKNFASLLINGEQVISLSITTDTLDLPDQYDNYFSPTKMEQDWIGIYSHSDITLFKIDAIAIYPYQVSEIIAKRRFVYGQGVDFPESIRSSASGSTIYVDYPFADYTNNYSYPSIGEWNQGISENIRVNNTVLSSPNYSLPQVFIEQKRTSITGLASTSSTIIFNGNNSFEVGDLINITGLVVNDTNSSAYNLSNAEIISANTTEFEVSNTTGIVANYSSGGTATAVVAQTIDDLLLELGNMQTSATDKYISLTPSNSWSNTNAYILFNSLNFLYQPIKAFYGIFEANPGTTAEQILFRIENESTKNYFEATLDNGTVNYSISYGNIGKILIHSEVVGIGIDKFTAGINIVDFAKRFSNNLLAFFGDPGQLKLYVGGDKSSNKKFTGKIYSFGFLTAKAFSSVSSAFSSANFVAINSELLLPLIASYTLKPKYYFDKFVLDIESMSQWEDYIPLRYFAKYVKDARNESYYDLDFLQFNISYPEAQKSNSDPSIYDTTNNEVKTYITFQQISDGANKSISEFTLQDAPISGAIVPGDEWLTTAYEVVDGLIIYPPSSMNISNLAIVSHIVIENKSVVYKPIVIKALEYSSESFDDLSPNAVGTRFGSSLYPYTRLGVYLDYKRKNPFTIYKGSTPYLYLTKSSGIRLRGAYGQPASRGLAAKINASKSEGYLLNGIQLFMKYDQPEFPLSAVELFEIEGADSQLRIYVQASNEDKTRGRIYALDTIAGRLDDSVVFYINGIPTNNPNINISEWSAIGIQFTGKLNFDNYVGEFRITGPAITNNISFYQYDQNRQAQTITFREWLGVLYSETSTLDWDYWNLAPNMQWRGVLYILSTKSYNIDLSQIFKSFMGTNKFITTGPATLLLKNYKYKVYKDAVWQTKTLSSV